MSAAPPVARRGRQAAAHVKPLRRRWRPSHTGAHTLCVLVSGPGECVALDLSAGYLIRTVLEPSLQAVCSPYELVRAGLAKGDGLEDPARPEAMTVVGDAVLAGKRLRRRLAHRLLHPLLAPSRTPLLGFRGPAASYWTLSGRDPSIAVVSPQRGPIVLCRRDGSVWVRFGSGSFVEELLLRDERIAATLRRSGAATLAGKALAQMLGWKPQLLVILLTTPEQGYCYKTVVALLP